jgi:hypothetical protein
MWHVVPSMKSGLHVIPLQRLPYSMYLSRFLWFELIGWVSHYVLE